MDLEKLRKFCLSLPHVTEDVKWGHDLCFLIGEKMFVVFGMDEVPVTASFKVTDEDFDKLSHKKGFKPAPYLARYKWIHVDDISFMSEKDWKNKIQTAYDLIKSKLPKAALKKLSS
jgi:predicted DNA-binding protein (MmcQ/YjbR family)